MPLISEVRKTGFWSVRVDLSKEFGLEEDAWVQLREPNNEEMFQFNKAFSRGDEGLTLSAEYFMQNIANFIEDHNFERSPGKKADRFEVGSLIQGKFIAFTKISGEFFGKIADANELVSGKKKQERVLEESGTQAGDSEAAEE